MDVQFNENQDIAPRPVTTREATGLMKLVISMGLAKDEAGAQKVLIGVLVLAVAATIAIVVLGGSGGRGDGGTTPPDVFENTGQI